MILGIAAIPDRTAIALSMVAAVTLLSALEPYFNWRSRWVLMEEAQYQLNRIRDEMDYYQVTTPAADLDPDRLHQFFTECQNTWNDVSSTSHSQAGHGTGCRTVTDRPCRMSPAIQPDRRQGPITADTYAPGRSRARP